MRGLAAWGVAAMLSACSASATFTVGVSTPIVYSLPPTPVVEHPGERAGFFWMVGHWDWQDNRWTWRDGRWEAQRVGYAWQPGAWNRRGNAWHWVEGRWAPASVTANVALDRDDSSRPPPVAERVALYPTAAPPTAKVEEVGAPRPGFTFIPGHYQWVSGKYEWTDGVWEAERKDQRWMPGRWQLQGTYYVWIEGGWATQSRPRRR